jgi:hypothetical protein
MQDLTELEQRLALAALWGAECDTETALSRNIDDDDVRPHLLEEAESYDGAAVKLGGDPTRHLYGATRNQSARCELCFRRASGSAGPGVRGYVPGGGPLVPHG